MTETTGNHHFPDTRPGRLAPDAQNPYIVLMKAALLSALPAGARRAVLGAICLAAACAPASADALSDRINADRIVRQRNVDIDVLRIQQRREDFAREQRILREIDRVNAPDLQRRLDVPTMHSTCQNQIRGNNAIGGRGCR